ncbi:MAG TPA: hypothetical protein VEX68_01880 [Bryobacteraceae bacterium]|nr:hypothetical protein [Bryobacteraceae bacterium]
MTAQLLRRQSNQLRQERRNGPLIIAGVVLFIALLSYWKFQLERSFWYDVGLFGAAAWAITSIVVLRKRIWPPPIPLDAFTASSVDFYRSELIEARSHMKAMWAWSAPAFLALGLLAVRLATKALGESIPLINVAPFAVLTIVWAGMFAIKTRSRLRELEAEIRQLDAAD